MRIVTLPKYVREQTKRMIASITWTGKEILVICMGKHPCYGVRQHYSKISRSKQINLVFAVWSLVFGTNKN
jgi:aspartokinase-like uncharacterized kinase